MSKVRLFGIAVYSAFALSALFVWSCSHHDEMQDGNGKIKVSVTDAPFSINLIEEAKITISKIEVRHKDSVGGNSFEVVYEGAAELNIADLKNGIVEELSDAEVPAGSYDLVRIYVDNASVKLVNGLSYDLKVPSGAQSGLKVFVTPEINVQGGLTTELLLDFELSKSFVAKGNPKYLDDVKGFNFKPVIRAINNSFAGRVEGFVNSDSEMALAGANVWLEADTVVSATFSDSTGFFALTGIPEGSYKLISAKEGFDTLVVDDVNVVAANKSEIDLQLTRNQE